MRFFLWNLSLIGLAAFASVLAIKLGPPTPLRSSEGRKLMRSRTVGIVLVLVFGLALSAFAADITGQWTATLDSVKDIMQGPLTKASDIIFGAVETDIDINGTHKTVPQTDEQWAQIRASAITVREDGYLIMMPGRIRDDKDWTTQSKAMIDAANLALKAAEAKDPDAVFSAGMQINRSCDRCHRLYPEQEQSLAPGGAITVVGEPHYTFAFKVDGEKLTGKVKSDNGETDIQDGVAKGDDLSFVENLDFQGQQIAINYTGKISGNQIKFTRKIGDLATDELSAKRAKAK
jgi:hypothetical protein